MYTQWGARLVGAALAPPVLSRRAAEHRARQAVEVEPEVAAVAQDHLLRVILAVADLDADSVGSRWVKGRSRWVYEPMGL